MANCSIANVFIYCPLCTELHVGIFSLCVCTLLAKTYIRVYVLTLILLQHCSSRIWWHSVLLHLFRGIFCNSPLEANCVIAAASAEWTETKTRGLFSWLCFYTEHQRCTTIQLKLTFFDKAFSECNATRRCFLYDSNCFTYTESIFVLRKVFNIHLTTELPSHDSVTFLKSLRTYEVLLTDTCSIFLFTHSPVPQEFHVKYFKVYLCLPLAITGYDANLKVT